MIVENWSDLLTLLPFLSHYDLKENELRKWSSTYVELFADIFSLLTFLSSGIITPSIKIFSLVDNEGAVSLMNPHSLQKSLVFNNSLISYDLKQRYVKYPRLSELFFRNTWEIKNVFAAY